MWAPADLFGPGLSALTFGMKRITTFFWEDPMALLIATLLAAGVIFAATVISNRRKRRA